MQLSPSEITYLGTLFEKTGPLSPFVNNKSELTGNEAQALEDKGVLKNGALTSEAQALLSPLAAPERCARLVLQKPFCLLEKYTYLKEGRLTLAESDGSGLVFTALESDSTPVIDVLDDFCPRSSIKASDFTVTLPISQALVLLAALDLCRARTLSACLFSSQADLSFTYEDLAAYIDSKFANGLVKGVAGNLGAELPEKETVPSLAVFLEQKGIFVPAEQKGRFLLEPNYRLFASNFLIYDSLMLLQAYQQTGENRLAASLDLCFISGMHDMIIFSVCPEGLEMAAISGADLRLRMKETLDCPEFPV